MIDTKQVLDSFAAACRARGLSVTHQRMAVYEALIGTDTHPGAEEIYRTVRSRFPTISRGTVYRTLETLCRLGLVADVGQTRGTARFEAALEPHHHLVCLSCRSIIDVKGESLEGLRLEGSAGASAEDEQGVPQGFEITGYQIQFVGYCRSCRDEHGRHPASKEQRNKQGGRHGKGTEGHQDA